MLLNDLVWQGTIFSGVAVALVVASVWWLYFSPVRATAGSAVAPSPRLAAWLCALLGLSAVQLLVGGMWDASQHLKTGRIVGGKDFLWPSHIVIYSAFLFSFVVGLAAIAAIGIPSRRAGVRDPRLWVRRNPYLGALALASAYELLALPGDAIWHAVFGIDLTAWSPPHLLIAVSMAAVLICAVGLLLQTRSDAEGARWREAGALILLSLMLNAVYFVGVLEWELPGVRTPLVNARPIWFYPAVAGCAAFFALLLARELSRFRWAATLTAALFYIVRLGATAGLSSTGNIAPHLPLIFLVGAILIDVVWLWRSALAVRTVTTAAAFTIGYAALVLPMISQRSDLPHFTARDDVMTVAVTFVVCFALFFVARWAAGRLLGQENPVVHEPAVSAERLPAGI